MRHEALRTALPASIYVVDRAALYGVVRKVSSMLFWFFSLL